MNCRSEQTSQSGSFLRVCKCLHIKSFRHLCSLTEHIDVTYARIQFHGSDLLNVYGPGDMTDYLVNFVTNLDPNNSTGIYWPQYTTDSPNLLTFLDGLVPLEITQDTYREEAIAFMMNVILQNPL